MAGEKTELSVHVRRMKFMQRCQTEETNRLLSENTNKVITSEHWELDLPELSAKESKYDVLDSFKELENLRYGRMSFQGFNKATEKMMKIWNNEEVEEEESKSDDQESIGSISDEEMAERFTTLVGSVAKKFKRRKTKSRYHNKSLPEVSESIVEEQKPEIPRKKRKKNHEGGFLKPKEE